MPEPIDAFEQCCPPEVGLEIIRFLTYIKIERGQSGTFTKRP